MFPKRGKIRTGEIISQETMAQVVAEASRRTLDAGRQQHAKQVAIAQQMQKVNAPLTALLQQDAVALQAAHDLRAMITLPENQRPIFTKVPPIHIEGSSLTIFTPPYPYPPFTEGQGAYAHADEGDFGFNMVDFGQGPMVATVTQGLASYQAKSTDSYLRFSPVVQYSYSFLDVPQGGRQAQSLGFIEFTISNDSQTLYDQLITLWQDTQTVSPNSGQNSDYYYTYPGGAAGDGVQIYLNNVTAGDTYYFTIECYGATQAYDPSLAFAQLDISIPFMVIENFSS